MASAAQNTARTIMPEETRRTPAKPAEKPKIGINSETVNMSFYRHKQESGTEPPFRRVNRGPKEERKADAYVKELQAKFEEMHEEDNEQYVESMATRFGIESEKMEKRRKLKEILAKKEPEVEFSL